MDAAVLKRYTVSNGKGVDGSRSLECNFFFFVYLNFKKYFLAVEVKFKLKLVVSRSKHAAQSLFVQNIFFLLSKL